MDYNSIWNEICFHVNKNRNASEKEFQTTVEFMFEKLGWSLFKGEILTQVTVGIGSASNLRPDIIIKKDGEEILVIELKKAVASLSDRDGDQLISYMRFAKLTFGVLIGSSLQIFCDFPDDNNLPVKVCDIPFTSDSEEGEECIELLSKANFFIEKLQEFSIKCLANPNIYNKKNKQMHSTTFNEKVKTGESKTSDYGSIYLGSDVYNLLKQPEYKDYYVGKKNIESVLNGKSKGYISKRRFYFNDKPSRIESSWMKGEKFVEIFDTSSGEISESEEDTGHLIANLVERASPDIQELFEQVRDYIISLDDESISEKPNYKEIFYFSSYKWIASIHIRRNWLKMYIGVKPYNLNEEELEDTFITTYLPRDPTKISVTVKNFADFERTKPFIDRAYNDN